MHIYKTIYFHSLKSIYKNNDDKDNSLNHESISLDKKDELKLPKKTNTFIEVLYRCICKKRHLRKGLKVHMYCFIFYFYGEVFNI